MIATANQLQMLKERYSKMVQKLPALEKLRETLLAIGGVEVVFFFEDKESTTTILKYGSIRNNTNVGFIRGKKSSCHDNAMKYAKSHKNIIWETGYALSNDGLWRQHSWLWNEKKKKILETTEPREKYFGYQIRFS